MDKDRINGAANQAKGAVKEAAGKITGDTKLQAEGKADKIKGKAQNAIGGVKDAARDALRDNDRDTNR
ncbi:MAG: CsbD family protein [Alphaproteobacteria bacterium]|nr:CsbD family protein [Alphaproteobacteria bacterium]MBL6937935.1 CsbD family protein [Alphaproteobacteria bacterium]MBL7099240.1 CsbD family protein [Alphaproteobacteria bacterium]